MDEIQERILLDSKVPLPNKLPYFHKSARSRTSFTMWNGTDVVLVPTDWHNPFAIRHELGHCYDITTLTPESRKRVARIIGHPGLRWWWGNWNPMRHARQPNMENFADWYAECAAGASGKQHKKLRKLLYEISGMPNYKG